MSTSRVTTTVSELRDALTAEQPPLVLDVRWALGDPYGRDHYADAHIPGAVYVDLDTELAAPPSPEGGRHPLPEIGELQAAARGWGLRQSQPVVVYDDLGNTAAARAWWLLRYAGVADVTLLDGALSAWRAAELPLESGIPADPEPGDVALSSGGLPLTDADTVPPNSPGTGYCWTPARVNGTGARWSRWTPARGTSRGRCPRPPGRTSRPTGPSCRPSCCASGSRTGVPVTPHASACTAVPVSPPPTRSPLSPSPVTRRPSSPVPGPPGPPIPPARP